ncbi:MAG: hypothetical protein WD118_04500 [Phycisphaeraceae bacterium]
MTGRTRMPRQTRFAGLAVIATALALLTTAAPGTPGSGPGNAPGSAPASAAEPGDRPLMRDFMGINIHSGSIFQLAPDHVDAPTLYRPAASLIRDYHGFSWDVGDDPAAGPNFPHDTWNWINWDDLYTEWTDQGHRLNVVIQFNGYGDLDGSENPIDPEDVKWDDAAADAKAYGRAFAAHFGPTTGNGLADSIQIGNEPGMMSDELFATVFRNMAEGVREVDPNLRIVTPNVTVGESHKYAKSIDLFADMTDLVDVYATHSYPQVQGWPTWERSYPEDPAIDYLTSIQAVIDWRGQHDADDSVWLTEFGYDSSTNEPDPNTEFKEWVGVTDTQQAQYLVRSFLVFSAMDMDRAYMYFFNDNDSASVHGSSGLTRDYEPKPSYWAQSHLHETLGDYRFAEALREDEAGVYLYAYEHEDDASQLVWVIWSATGDGSEIELTLGDLPGSVLRAEGMPLADGPAPAIDFEQLDTGSIRLMVTESPTYLRIALPEPTSAIFIGVGGLALLARPHH